MSAMYRQVLLDLPLFTNFTEDLKTQKPTKSSISLLKSANREIKAQKGKGGGKRCPDSILSFSRSHLQHLNQASKTDRENKHKPQKPQPSQRPFRRSNSQGFSIPPHPTHQILIRNSSGSC